MKYYHGANRQTAYFEGWYLAPNTLAPIPGVQMDNYNRGVYPGDHAGTIVSPPFPISDCRIGEKHLSVQIETIISANAASACRSTGPSCN
ncbi:MAG: hypothetical protein ACLSAP_07515 [Oscillospiraceae bacterium]